MKANRLVIGSFLLGVAMANAEIKPDDLIRAVNQMSPEQANEFQQKLEARMWKPIPQGFFTRMAADVAISSASLDSVKLSSISLSGGDMDVDQVGGLDLGLLWRIFNDRFRFGFRLGSWAVADSNLGPAGYSRAEVAGGSFSLAANYQWVRSESWLLWTEVALGSGTVAIETVDTPIGHATTIRELGGTFGQADVQIGASWRFNPVLSLFLSGGYRMAESVDLDEGGQTSSVKFDASGFNSRVGLGVNF